MLLSYTVEIFMQEHVIDSTPKRRMLRESLFLVQLQFGSTIKGE